MNNQFPPLPVRIFIGLLILSTIGYYAFRALAPETTSQLKASGTIEAVVVNASPEMAGKVADVLVSEGQAVQTGDPLLALDANLLTAQQAVASAQVDSAKAALETASAALATAQAQYDTALNNAIAAEKATRLTVWKSTKPTDFEQPAWYFSKEERLKAAQADVDAKKADLDAALQELADISDRAGSSNFVAVEAKLAQMRLALQTAQAVFDSTSGGSDSQSLRDAAQVVLDEAKIDLDDAQKEYDDALTTEGAQDVLDARAKAMVAQELYDSAVDNLRALQTGADSQAVINAGKVLEQAKSALNQAQSAVRTAEANLALIEAQMSKLTVTASMDGVILTRNVEPGEFVQPGAVALTMANLNELTITVYVPEDQYGRIALGQSATVTVDSFAGETFEAVVIHIADQAEFTPRNVQTVEGRSSTVYAIKLKLTDPEGKLKIGMPADVVFE